MIGRSFHLQCLPATVATCAYELLPTRRPLTFSKLFPQSSKSPWNHCAPRSYATMAPIERITDKLETSSLDDRSYRVIRLPNKLEALLVHDPDTDKASASVNVNVGSFSDADDMPGMAHAVEHLLFMGTEKVVNPTYMPHRYLIHSSCSTLKRMPITNT